MPNIANFRLPGEIAKKPDQADLDALTHLLEKYAPHDDGFELIKDGVRVYRESKQDSKRSFMLSQPSICIVPQGAKAVTLATDSFEYDQTKMVVYAAEIPMNVRITKASKEEPYYCMVIPLDTAKLNELNLKVFPDGIPKTHKTRAVYVGDTNPKILKSAVRLMELIEQQENVDLLAPLIIEEILIHLLRSSEGPAIAQIGVTDSHAEKVGKAISWLKSNYTQPIKMDELAKISGMSVSSFHTHFKAMTGLSPLQFQKTLRLQEARTLIQGKMMDISGAAFAVGYTSPTQFSREYSREFGVSPSKDQ
jgi:AraC-like DNA-binding protein